MTHREERLGVPECAHGGGIRLWVITRNPAIWVGVSQTLELGETEDRESSPIQGDIPRLFETDEATGR